MRSCHLFYTKQKKGVLIFVFRFFAAVYRVIQSEQALGADNQVHGFDMIYPVTSRQEGKPIRSIGIACYQRGDPKATCLSLIKNPDKQQLNDDTGQA